MTVRRRRAAPRRRHHIKKKVNTSRMPAGLRRYYNAKNKARGYRK